VTTLLAWLFGFLRLGVADGDLPPGDDLPPDDPPADDPPADDPPADDDLSLEAADDDPPADDAAADTESAKAIKAAQDEAAELRRQLAARNTGTPAPTDEQRTHEQEEARLHDPKTTELERWQIQSNRTLRENNRKSGMALFQAQDISDRTAFNQLAVTKPAIHKRYAERVEAEVTRMRAAGQNAPREAVLRYLIGNDAMEGKLSAKKAAKAADTSTIDRGRSPGARSDVAARGRMTESQKREKRLEGVQI